MFVLFLGPLMIAGSVTSVTPDQTSDDNGLNDPPILVKIFTNVQMSSDGIFLEYNVLNLGEEAIHAVYILNDRPDLIQESSIVMPEFFEFQVVEVVPAEADLGEPWTAISWHSPMSADDPSGILPGETLTFSFRTAPLFDEVAVAPSFWSVSNLSGRDAFFNDLKQGQIVNSSYYYGWNESYIEGVASVPTLVHVPPSCDIPKFNSSLTHFLVNSTGVKDPSTRNLTKDIDVYGASQWWTNPGRMGCLPTSMAYSLSWWGQNGVAPTDGSANPLNVTNFTNMTDLANDLAEATNTTEQNGTQSANFTEGLEQWIKNKSLPLNVSFYEYTNSLNRSNGVPGPDTVIDEFMRNREDVVISIIGRQGAHALTVVGVNTTNTSKGYQVTLLDPDTGQTYHTHMKALYFTGNAWSDQPAGNTTYAQIEYRGKMYAVNALWAVSPSDPRADVEDSANDDSDGLVTLQSKVRKNSGTLIFSYEVLPRAGSGALVESFVVDTNLSYDPSVLSSFVHPQGWQVTFGKTPEDTLRVYFHNNRFNGANVSHLPLSGGSFGFSYQGGSTYGDWFVDHSGLPMLSAYIEDGSFNYRDQLNSGQILVPSEESVQPQPSKTTTTSGEVETTTSTDTSSTEPQPGPNQPTSTISIELGLFMTLFSVLAVAVKRARRRYL